MSSGADADRPAEIPARGWWQIVKRAWREAKTDQVPLLAAGVAFFAFLSLFPALIAAVLLYGLFADPATVASQAAALTANMPAEAAQLIESQLTGLTSAPRGSLGLGAVITVLLALWSASSGVDKMMTAVSTAYDEEDTRGFVKRKGLALLLTVAAIVFMLIMLGLVAALPVVFGFLESGPLRWLLEAVRWVLFVVLVMVALAVLYRVAPDRDSPKLRWVSVGAIVATVLWVLASVGFTLYVALFGNYAKTYGAMAGVVMMLLWLWITCYAILLGAEINAESEEQTRADTTRGEPRPLGERQAVKADSVPSSD